MTAVPTSVPSPPPSWSSLQVGGATFHPYALFVLAAIVVAAWMTDRRLVRRGEPRGRVLDVVVWAVPLGIVGARLAHVVTSPAAFFGPGGSPVRVLFLWSGGLEAWGALLLGGVGAWVGCRRSAMATPPFLDVAAPGLLVGLAVARVGSWFNQDLVGRPTDLPWGLQIAPALRPAAFAEQATFHPLSLYEALWALLAAALLVVWERRARREPGTVFLAAATAYALGRLWIDLLRADPAAQVLGLPVTVVVSLLAVVLGVAGLALAAGGSDHGAPGTDADPVLPGTTAGSPPHDMEPSGATALPAGTSEPHDGGPTPMSEPTTDPEGLPADPVRRAAPGAAPLPAAVVAPEDVDLPGGPDGSDEVDVLEVDLRDGAEASGVVDLRERADRERASLELARSERESAEDEAEQAAARLEQALERLQLVEGERESALAHRAEADRLAEQASRAAEQERAAARAAQQEAERAAAERAAEQDRRAQEQRAASDAELAGARDAVERATEAVQEAQDAAEQHRRAVERARRTADERAAAQASLAGAAREAQRAEQEEADRLAQEVQRARERAEQTRLAAAEAEVGRAAAEQAAAEAQQDAERADAERSAALDAAERAAQEADERAADEASRSEQALVAAAADLAEVERAQAAAQGAEAHEALVRAEAERARARTDRLTEEALVVEEARTTADRADEGDLVVEEPAEVAAVRHAAEAAEAAAARASAEREEAAAAVRLCEDAVGAASEQRRAAEEGFTRTEDLLAQRVARAEAQQEVEREAARRVAAERLSARAAAARRAGLVAAGGLPSPLAAGSGTAPASAPGEPPAPDHDEGHAPEVPRRRARSWLAGRFADAARRLEDGR